VRILTKDPVIQEKLFGKGADMNMSTKFCFVVWNFTDEVAQILSATPKMARTFQNIATDPDFGSNLQKCDIKISPEGEMLERVYDINVLRHSGSEKPITASMVEMAKEIDLDKDVQDSKGRLSTWEPPTATKANPPVKAEAAVDQVIEDMGGEPINLDDIPF